ncbi:MAG: ATP-binding protein [Candidatus Omnitrophica bacterium]|nr:ATP-binding protein [Candidatus Omnitrophota bacterium]
MMSLAELWKDLKFASDYNNLTASQRQILEPILYEEFQARELRRIAYLMRRSGLKRIKRIEDFDWTFNPKIPRDKIMRFFESSDWVSNAENIVFIGPAGVGKSHLADSLCYNMISQLGIPTTRITCFDLVEKLKKGRNKYNLLNYYASVKVLCLDELGYVFPSQDQANDIFQIISKRSEVLPTIITTNLIPSGWSRIFEASTATAILDRLSFKGTFITCEGRSYRRKR